MKEGKSEKAVKIKIPGEDAEKVSEIKVKKVKKAAAPPLLTSLFSDASKSLFARTLKPEEFISKKRPDGLPRPDPIDEEKKLAKEEKRKIKRAKRYERLEQAEDAVISKAQQPDSDHTGAELDSESAPPSKREQDVSSSSGSRPLNRSSEADDRSIFIGNVPLSASVPAGIAQMRSFCEKYGEVESLRLRSLPIEGTAVDESGNQTLVRKICAQQSKLGIQKGSMNVYVVFKHASAVSKALLDNNMLMGEGKAARHVRIDRSTPSVFPPAHTVFLGGLPHYADEEEIRAHFAAVLPNGQQDILGIRLVRDSESMVGKGIGYLLLSDRDAVMAALTLNQLKYKKRWELRVTPCAKRTKTTVSGPNGIAVKRPAETSEGPDGPKKRRKDKNPVQPGAMQRIFKGKPKAAKAANKVVKPKSINLKNTVTRKKLLLEKGQKKEKGRKGKRLGGNVKKAMKAMKG